MRKTYACTAIHTRKPRVVVMVVVPVTPARRPARDALAVRKAVGRCDMGG